MYIYEYPRPTVTVDIAIFRPLGEEYQILLIQRARAPYKGKYALPGGFIEMDESLEAAAQRELFEETGAVKYSLKQLSAYEGLYKGKKVYGVLFYAEITEFQTLPESEIAAIVLSDGYGCPFCLSTTITSLVPIPAPELNKYSKLLHDIGELVSSSKSL